MQIKKQQLELDMEQQTDTKLGRTTSRLYLTYMQSTSCEMLGWMQHNLESKSTIHPNSEEIESPWIVTAAMKLKDTCSLEKKL